MFKKWLAVLGAVVLIVCTSQLLWGTGGSGGGDEHPWNEATGGGSGGRSITGTSTGGTPTVTPLKSVFILRPAPMGGFYIVRVNLPSNGSAKPVTGGKKVEN